MKSHTIRRACIFSSLIALVAFAVYMNTLYNGFIWDDYFIVENSSKSGLGLYQIARFFIDKNAYHAPGEIYRPLYLFSFALDYRIYGSSPWGWHLTNICLHIINSVLVYFFALSLLSGRGDLDEPTRRVGLAALGAALVFAVHPVHTESVAWIKGRDDMLACVFILASFIFYIAYSHRQKGLKYYCASIITFIPALLSKEMALTLPLLFILYELCFKPSGLRRGKGLTALVPFFVLAGLYLGVRTAVTGQVAQTAYFGGGLGPALFTTARGFVRYFSLLTIPLNQCGDYLAFPLSYGLTPRVILSILIVGAFLAAGVVSYFFFLRPLAFLIFWFFVTMMPVSNIIPLKILLAERFLYIPSVGIFVLFGMVFSGVLEKARPRAGLRRFLIITALLVMTLYAFAAVERNRVWRDERTFWSDVIAKYPGARAYTNYGLAMEDEGDIRGAIKFYQEALKMDPRFSYALNNLAANYLKEGLVDEAIKSYREAVAIEPGNAVMHSGLGDAYRKKGLLKEAAAEYRRAIELDPGSDAVMGLARVYIDLGLTGEAKKLLMR
ncbi:MAG: tetratricopeptide repeat protein [Thermodesulfobacteriota bacterium]